MKRNILQWTLAVVLLVGSLTACDLNTTPSTRAEEDLVLKDVENINKVLTGSMRTLMESFYTYANPGYGAFLRTGDAMGSDVAMNKKYGFSNQYGFHTLYSDGGTNIHSWNLGYKIIYNMNRALAAIDEASGDDQLREVVKAQAYGMRAFMYLHYASNYSFAIDKDPNAVNVPIYDEHNFDKGLQPASNVSEVYAFVLADVARALDFLPADYNRDEKWQIDRAVLLGIGARAALYSRNWKLAADYSDELLGLNSYLMNEKEYNEGFNDIQNREWLWGHAQTMDQQDASYQFNFLDVTSSSSYYYSFNADPYFRDLFDEGDYRKKMINWGIDPGSDPLKQEFVWMRYNKFRFKKDNTADIVLMRTAEIYLINAEAKTRLNSADGLSKLNQLKAARDAQSVNLSGDELIQEIWLERRKELFGEGFSMVDIIRNQQKVVRKEYPQEPKITLTLNDKNGEPVTKDYMPQGHRIFKFPVKDNNEFVPNSKFYLYRIPEKEERLNKLIYSKYPRLDIYDTPQA